MIVCVCNRLNEQRIGAAICGGAHAPTKSMHAVA